MRKYVKNKIPQIQVENQIARMAELVDALVSGTSIERCGDSSSLPGTKYSPHSLFRLSRRLNKLYRDNTLII